MIKSNQDSLSQNQRSRISAIRKYYEDPNVCQFVGCGAVINVGENQKVSTVRRKKFCDKSCASFSQHKSPSKNKKTKYEPCPLCSQPKYKTAQICQDCRSKQLTFESGQTLKGDLFNSRKYNVARSHIRRHAETAYKQSKLPMCCHACGYDRHVEICHIKAVSDFSDSTSLSQINHLDNLVALCRNHHWEFDNGFIQIKTRSGKH